MTATKLLELFIPSADRHEQPIDQDRWLREALNLLAKCFGGATAFPRGKGVWRDDAQHGRIIEEEPVIVHCYTSAEALEQHLPEVQAFLLRLGQQTNQAAVAYVVGGTYVEHRFPLPQNEVDHG